MFYSVIGNRDWGTPDNRMFLPLRRIAEEQNNIGYNSQISLSTAMTDGVRKMMRRRDWRRVLAAAIS